MVDAKKNFSKRIRLFRLLCLVGFGIKRRHADEYVCQGEDAKPKFLEQGSADTRFLPRYYAIVLTSDGRDLSELLVRAGLVRIPAGVW